MNDLRETNCKEEGKMSEGRTERKRERNEGKEQSRATGWMSRTAWSLVRSD